MNLPTDESRAAQRAEFGLFDLGRMPAEVRDLAYAWGGTVAGGIALYQVASTDGLTRDPAELRAEVEAIPETADRADLLAWLEPAPDMLTVRGPT